MTAAASRRERTALYRIFGDADLLLYIGISKNFGSRWEQHAETQPWWGEMRRLTVDHWYNSREVAEAAEEAAIKAEQPKYNVVHNRIDEQPFVPPPWVATITPALIAQIRAAAELAPERTGYLCMDAGMRCLRASPSGCYGESKGSRCLINDPSSECVTEDSTIWARDPVDLNWRPIGRSYPQGTNSLHPKVGLRVTPEKPGTTFKPAA